MSERRRNSPEHLREQLLEVEARYTAVLDRYRLATSAARVGVWDWNFRDNAFFMDSNIKVLLGYEDGQVENALSTYMSLVHPGDRGMVTAAAQALIQGEIRENTLEHRMVHKDGSTLWFMVQATLASDEQGHPYRLLGINTEITRRKQLEMNIQEAVSAEHARISLNLHDGLAQELAGISFLLQSLENRLQSADSPFARDVADIHGALADSIQHTRELARGLYPVPSGPVGIKAMLRKLALGTSRIFKVRCEVTGETDGELPLDPNQSNEIYFIAQEAVNNAIRHGQADHIEIRCTANEDEILLSVADNGVWARNPGSDDQGMGLRIMGYRARNLGGDLAVIPRDTGGSRLVCRIPAGKPNP